MRVELLNNSLISRVYRHASTWPLGTARVLERIVDDVMLDRVDRGVWVLMYARVCDEVLR